MSPDQTSPKRRLTDEWGSSKFPVKKDAAITQVVEQFQLEGGGDQFYMAVADERFHVGRREHQSSNVCRAFGLTTVDSIMQSRSNTECDAMHTRLQINNEAQNPHRMVAPAKDHSNGLALVPNKRSRFHKPQG